MNDEHDSQPIQTEIDLTKEFGAAAAPERKPEHTKPVLNFDPPTPAGPGLGGMAPGAPNTHDRNVSPQLRNDEPSTPPRLRDQFNIESGKKAFREMFNRKAKERGNENGMER